MIIFLSELQKDHLKLLHQHSIHVLVDFCKLCIDYLINGVNHNKIGIAAEKLGVSKSTIQNLVHALLYLIVESSKHNLSDLDFKSSLALAGFSSEQQEVLIKLYNTKKSELSNSLRLLHQKDPVYQNFTWRLEVEVASRSYVETVKPIITIDLVLLMPKKYGNNIEQMFTKPSDKAKNKNISQIQINNSISDAKATSQCQNIINHVLLQCDLSNLVYLSNKLEQALKESKSTHVRKIQRVLQ